MAVIVIVHPHHDASLEQQVVDGLSDVGRVHKVVIGVLVLAVAHLQRADEGDERRDGDLEKRTREEVCLTGTVRALHPDPSGAVAPTLKRCNKSYLVRSS